MVGSAFLKDAADFLQKKSPLFFGCQDFWYTKNSPKSCKTRRGGIWDDMPGVLVELRDFQFDLFPDSEDEEEEAGSWAIFGKGTARLHLVISSDITQKGPTS